MAGLESWLTPALFQDVRAVWFAHLATEDDLVLPAKSHVQHWFGAGGSEFDGICVERFASTLAAIRASGVTTGDALLNIAQPRSPLDWVSLVILLDQIPRNCYRGSEAAVVFQVFDPLALQIALTAFAQGVVMEPVIRWHVAYRTWLLMPLMHSEDVAVHEQAVAEFTHMERDLKDMVASEDAPAEADTHRSRAWTITRERADAAKALGETFLGFEKRHQAIIQQFGRYPHRNKVLEREPTPAETEYLENGGQTFG